MFEKSRSKNGVEFDSPSEKTDFEIVKTLVIGN